VIIVHDRDPTHLSSRVVQLVVGKVMILPPRPPGINPLDYAGILNSKRWLEKNRPCDWYSRRTEFVEHIRMSNPDAHVAGYAKTLEPVIAANGGRIDW